MFGTDGSVTVVWHAHYQKLSAQHEQYQLDILVCTDANLLSVNSYWYRNDYPHLTIIPTHKTIGADFKFQKIKKVRNDDFDYTKFQIWIFFHEKRGISNTDGDNG